VARTVLRGDRRSNAAVLPDNKNHYVRDVTFHEDAKQAYTGNGPQVMATLRNIAVGLIRLDGANTITRTTEWIGRQPLRALPIIAT
jgi:hypothetical protein